MGSAPLFDLSDGRKLLGYCDRHGVVVLGIEGFQVLGDKRVSNYDCIADFSALMITGEEFSTFSRMTAVRFFDFISNMDTFVEFVLVVI
ncbi:hypothetical protein PSCICG_11000 [Pseudomonas cichorii]|nr:hypothetical protein PSCICG_11000 [Pseudomonas cichorii]